jgi:hypothetical protein
VPRRHARLEPSAEAFVHLVDRPVHRFGIDRLQHEGAAAKVNARVSLRLSSIAARGTLTTVTSSALKASNNIATIRGLAGSIVTSKMSTLSTVTEV